MWSIKYLVGIIRSFLPPYAEIIQLDTPENEHTVGTADLDGDGILEVIGAFYWHGENYIIVLKYYYGTWQVVNIVKGKGYNITYFGAAPITSKYKNNLVVGWKVATIWSDLSLYDWKDNGLQDLIVGNKYYSMIEVKDMENDGLHELALWIHDKGDAYRVEIIRWARDQFTLAKDVYPHYFKKVELYFRKILKEKDSTTYWYYLADAQLKIGNTEEALKSIDKALSFEYPYPSKEELMKLRNQLCKYESFVNQDDLDLSSIEYICSETQRDIKLEKALIREFLLDKYQDRARYYYNKIDLDDDGKSEIFAYLVGSSFCGTGGCSAAIFKEKKNNYYLLARFSIVKNPVIISDSKTKGYKDIIMNVYGGGIVPFFARLKYDGTTYPSNPSIQPKVEPGTKLAGVAIVADDIGRSPGIELNSFND
jgi:hypothetical protein